MKLQIPPIIHPSSALSIIFIFFSIQLYAQKERKTAYLIESIPGALIEVVPLNDSSWQKNYYYNNGPIIRSETYRDEKGTVLNGNACYYRLSGDLDSCGSFVNGVAESVWKYYNGKAGIQKKKLYAHGIIISEMDVKPEPESKEKDPSEKEAEYPGGPGAWNRYIYRKMQLPERARDAGTGGTVIVGFTVDEMGYVSDEFMIRSIEFSLDTEALRIIRESPKWIPARKAGLRVVSYKQQAITFRLSGVVPVNQ